MNASPGKLSWGTGVVISFAVFVAAILVMVYIAASQRVDLVADQYYDQALRYQDRIDAKKRSSGPEDVTVRVVPDAVFLQFPPAAQPDRSAGTIVLYRPANILRDIVVRIVPDTAGVQSISTAALDRGLWRVKVAWTAGGIERFHEEPIMIR
jgi:nitrogen fixation protein FixH